MRNIRQSVTTHAVICAVIILYVIGMTGRAEARTAPEDNSSDIIVFVTGESLRGRFLREMQGCIEFDSIAVGRLAVPKGQVRELTVDGSHRTLRDAPPAANAANNERSLSQSRLTDAGGPLMPVSAYPESGTSGVYAAFAVEPGANAVGNARATPGAAAPPRNEITLGVNVPEAYTYGTQSQENLGGDVLFTANQTQHVWDPPSWLTNLHLTGSHIRTWKVKSTAVTTNVYDGTLTVSNAFSKNTPTTYYGIADLASNNSLGIGLQQSYGGGISTLVYDSEHTKTPPSHYKLLLMAYGDVRYMHERLYAPALPLDLAGIRIAEDFTYEALDKDKKPRFTIAETAWVIPTLNDIHALQTFGRLQLTWPIGEYVALSLTQEDDFLNNAPVGKRKNWSKSGATFSFTFPVSGGK